MLSPELNIRTLHHKYFYDDNSNGLINLATDLEIDPDGPLLLALAWKIKAENMGEFSEDEWVNGLMNILKVNGLDQLKEELAKIEIELAVPEEFRELYQFSYTYALSSPHQTKLSKDVAIILWQSLLNEINVLFWINGLIF